MSLLRFQIQSNPNQLAAFPAAILPRRPHFEVNGLTGLLAKEATITVKYSSDDLSKAGGNASKLTLMRWKQGTNQWVALKTKVDTTAMTLSTTSNQMGIFGSCGGHICSSGTNWIIIGIIAVVVIIIAFVVASRITEKTKTKAGKKIIG